MKIIRTILDLVDMPETCDNCPLKCETCYEESDCYYYVCGYLGDKIEYHDRTRLLNCPLQEIEIEKQTSKKVVQKVKNYSGLPVSECPRCGNRHIDYYTNNYCSNCGQKLSWEVESDYDETK